jgi:hypothetical protein
MMAKKKAAKAKKKATRKKSAVKGKRSKPKKKSVKSKSLRAKSAARKSKPKKPKPKSKQKPPTERSIEVPYQDTDVVRVTGDNYYICRDCEGEAPAMMLGGVNTQPWEGFTRIIYPPMASLDRYPDEVNDEPVSFNTDHTRWYQRHRNLTTVNIGHSHQFIIWFKYASGGGMDPPEYSLPDSRLFKPKLVASCG